MSLDNQIKTIRERVNIRLYDSRDSALKLLSFGSLFVALFTIVSLVIYHGFQLNDVQNKIIGYIVRGSIGYYLVKFIIELITIFNPVNFCWIVNGKLDLWPF